MAEGGFELAVKSAGRMRGPRLTPLVAARAFETAAQRAPSSMSIVNWSSRSYCNRFAASAARSKS